MRLSHALALTLVTLSLACTGKSSTSTGTIPPQAADTSKPAADEDEDVDLDEEDELGGGENKEPTRPKAAGKITSRPGALTVGTFNLKWAHDHEGGGSKRIKANRAQNEKDWSWKRDAIAAVLARTKLQVVGLEELGGEEELDDIVAATKKQGGPAYTAAIVKTADKGTGHHVGILSSLPITNARRFKIHMRRHMAADIEVAGGKIVTVVVVHAPEGDADKSSKARRQQAKAVKREVRKLAKNHPVILMGTIASRPIPGAKDYRFSSAGVLAGDDTKGDRDDCGDSADSAAAAETTVAGGRADRIFACGLDLEDAKVLGRSQIVRKEADPADSKWPEVAVDKPPHRDVSDHLVLIAELALRPEQKPAQVKKDAGKPAKVKKDKPAKTKKGKPAKVKADAGKPAKAKKGKPAKAKADAGKPAKAKKDKPAKAKKGEPAEVKKDEKPKKDSKPAKDKQVDPKAKAADKNKKSDKPAPKKGAKK